MTRCSKRFTLGVSKSLTTSENPLRVVTGAAARFQVGWMAASAFRAAHPDRQSRDVRRSSRRILLLRMICRDPRFGARVRPIRAYAISHHGKAIRTQKGGYSSAMPYITFMWHPKADEFLVAPIVDDLRQVADGHNVSFHVNAKEAMEKDDDNEKEDESVILNAGVALPEHVVAHLRQLATQAGVTIYVQEGA